MKLLTIQSGVGGLNIEDSLNRTAGTKTSGELIITLAVEPSEVVTSGRRSPNVPAEPSEVVTSGNRSTDVAVEPSEFLISVSE